MNNDRLEKIIQSWESARTLDDLNLTPTDGMVSEAKRGLAWRDEFNRGGTAVGIARARDIANRKRLSPDTVMRMHSFFSRHEVDKKGKGFSSGEGYPSNGRIAWALWGGDAGQSWARKMSSQIKTIRENSGLEYLEEEYLEELEEGDIVEFTLSGTQTLGSIEYVMTEGYFGTPGSQFYTPASTEDPVLLLRIWTDGRETELLTGRRASEVTKMDDD